MTRWVDTVDGGRDRGPRGIARAWLEVLVRPRRFFRTGVSSGDQAPGLTFLMVVVLLEEASRFLLVENAYPALPIARPLAVTFWLAVVVLLVAPLGLHLVTAVQTLLLLPLADDRAGVSQTVQVIAYATAPCVVSGVPVPELRLAAAAYGAVLFVLGLAIVHRTSLARACLAGAVPIVLVFGYGFRSLGALADLGVAVPL